MPSRPGDTGWGERASREQKGKRNFPHRLSLSPPPRCPGGPGARSPVALGSGHPHSPDLIPGALRSPMAGDPWRRDEGKVSDSRRPMAGAGGPLRLREWLVAQIESGRYAGLRWEDAGKTLFRIPWKHAAKQGYQVRQDAALFRVREWGRGSQVWFPEGSVCTRSQRLERPDALPPPATRSALNLGCL